MAKRVARKALCPKIAGNVLVHCWLCNFYSPPILTSRGFKLKQQCNSK